MILAEIAYIRIWISLAKPDLWNPDYVDVEVQGMSYKITQQLVLTINKLTEKPHSTERPSWRQQQSVFCTLHAQITTELSENFNL